MRPSRWLQLTQVITHAAGGVLVLFALDRLLRVQTHSPSDEAGPVLTDFAGVAYVFGDPSAKYVFYTFAVLALVGIAVVWLRRIGDLWGTIAVTVIEIRAHTPAFP